MQYDSTKANIVKVTFGRVLLDSHEHDIGGNRPGFYVSYEFPLRWQDLHGRRCNLFSFVNHGEWEEELQEGMIGLNAGERVFAIWFL